MNITSDNSEQYIVILRALPNRDGVPAIIRLRRFLKMALRGYGLRCVACEPVGKASDNGKGE